VTRGLQPDSRELTVEIEHTRNGDRRTRRHRLAWGPLKCLGDGDGREPSEAERDHDLLQPSSGEVGDWSRGSRNSDQRSPRQRKAWSSSIREGEGAKSATSIAKCGRELPPPDSDHDHWTHRP
jgi:hypothetical protein